MFGWKELRKKERVSGIETEHEWERVCLARKNWSRKEREIMNVWLKRIEKEGRKKWNWDGKDGMRESIWPERTEERKEWVKKYLARKNWERKEGISDKKYSARKNWERKKGTRERERVCLIRKNRETKVGQSDKEHLASNNRSVSHKIEFDEQINTCVGNLVKQVTVWFIMTGK